MSYTVVYGDCCGPYYEKTYGSFDGVIKDAKTFIKGNSVKKHVFHVVNDDQQDGAWTGLTDEEKNRLEELGL